ncbi:hypothetical protein R6Q59_023019 [Mikania micrantha]
MMVIITINFFPRAGALSQILPLLSLQTNTILPLAYIITYAQKNTTCSNQIPHLLSVKSASITSPSGPLSDDDPKAQHQVVLAQPLLHQVGCTVTDPAASLLG